jgi:hypothetical protein
MVGDHLEVFSLGFRNTLFVGHYSLSILLSFLILPIVVDFMGMNITLKIRWCFFTNRYGTWDVDNGIVVVENGVPV